MSNNFFATGLQRGFAGRVRRGGVSLMQRGFAGLRPAVFGFCIAFFCITGLLCAAPSQALASSKPYEVVIENDRINTSAGDFFSYSELLPGQTREGSANIINNSQKRQRVSFNAGLTSNEEVSKELMQAAQLQVSYGDELIYEGALEGAGAPAGGVELCSLDAGEKGNMTWALHIPEEISNEHAKAYGEVKWGWTSKPLVVGGLAKAGDKALAAIVVLCAIIGLAILIRRKFKVCAATFCASALIFASCFPVAALATSEEVATETSSNEIAEGAEEVVETGSTDETNGEGGADDAGETGSADEAGDENDTSDPSGQEESVDNDNLDLDLSDSGNPRNPDETEEDVQKTVAAVGSNLKWTISQRVNFLGVDSITRYHAFVFEDTLPKETTFVKATVFGANGADVTSSAGSISYNETTKVVRYAFNYAWLQNTMPMIGETYNFEIIARIIAYPEDDVIKNRGRAFLNNLMMETNETQTEIHRAALTIEKSVAISELTPNLDGQALVDFESSVTQTEKNAAAKEVTITDEMPEELAFECGSLEIKDKNGKPIEAKITETERGFTAVVDRLNFKDCANLYFKCSVTDKALDKEVVNEIKAQAAGINQIKASSSTFFVRNTVAPRTIFVDVRIPQSNIQDKHGFPVFLIVIKGIDVEGRLRAYRGLVCIDQNSKISEDGFAEAQCIIENVAAGEYRISQELPSRYSFVGIDLPSENVVIENGFAKAELITQKEASCRFTNEKTSWSYLSDTDFAINKFPGGAKWR